VERQLLVGQLVERQLLVRQLVVHSGLELASHAQRLHAERAGRKTGSLRFHAIRSDRPGPSRPSGSRHYTASGADPRRPRCDDGVSMESTNIATGLDACERS
jgi:hypothetical protein